MLAKGSKAESAKNQKIFTDLIKKKTGCDFLSTLIHTL